jgi:exonuclease III
MEALKIVTLNIYGMWSPMKLQMLKVFICRQNMDVIFLQEVATYDMGQIRGNTSYYNIGTTMRGTEIVARNTLQLTKINTVWKSNGSKLGELTIGKHLRPIGNGTNGRTRSIL